jgi:hypothetical protein
MSNKKKERHIACYNVQKFDPPPARTKQKHSLGKVHDEHAKIDFEDIGVTSSWIEQA